MATYFAVVDGFEEDGAVFAYPASPINTRADQLCGSMRQLTFESLDETSTDIVWPLLPVFHTKRSAAQRGCFTIPTNPLCDHGDVISELADGIAAAKRLAKVVIPAELKPECLDRLRSMNITAWALFPGPDGIGRAASERAKVRIWS